MRNALIGFKVKYVFAGGCVQRPKEQEIKTKLSFYVIQLTRK